MFMKGDLHIHSTASDGSLSPSQIVISAKKRGIDTIAICDHNSVDGLTEACEAGRKHGVSVIPAVELSTRFNGESIHILGYFRDRKFNSTIFKQILMLVKAHEVLDLRAVMWGCRKHRSSDKHLSSPEGISLLKTFGAAVVLAHPVRISELNLLSLINMPFDGIEAKYGSSDDYYTRHFIDLAREKFSFYTGGSDFHGEHSDKAGNHKHCIIGEPYLDSAEIRKFLKNSGALVLGKHSHHRIS